MNYIILIILAGAKIPEKVQIGNYAKVIYFDVADEKNQVLDFEATTKVISEAINKETSKVNIQRSYILRVVQDAYNCTG